MMDHMHSFARRAAKAVFPAFLRSGGVPLASDPASRLLPWVIALLTYLAAILLASSLSFNMNLDAFLAARTGTLTIQIYDDGQGREATERKALRLLDRAGTLENIRVVSEARLRRLLAPWLGMQGGDARLSLPVVIEAEAAAEGDPEAAAKALAARLEQAFGAVSVSSNQAWVESLAGALSKLKLAIFAMAVLMMGVTVAIIVLVARTHLKLYAQAVELLHFIGAQDDYIAAQFQAHAFRMALKGSAIGCLLAAPTVWLAGVIASQSAAPLFPVFSFSWIHALAFFWLVLATAVIALLSTRFAILKDLRRQF